MDIKETFSNELKEVFKYIKNTVIKDFPTDIITLDYFIYAIMSKHDCVAYKILNRTMLSNAVIELKKDIENRIKTENKAVKVEDTKYDEIFDECLQNINSLVDSSKKMLSVDFLLSIMSTDDEIRKILKSHGVTKKLIKISYKNLTQKPKTEVADDVNNSMTIDTATDNIKTKKTVKNNADRDTITEKELKNLTAITNDEAYGDNKKIYDKIFSVLTKRNGNNVILVGENGVGKTCLCGHLANRLSNGDVPKELNGKQMMLVDFPLLHISGGGMMMGRCANIINDAASRDKYIFLIDDIDYMLSDASHMGDAQVDRIIQYMAKLNTIGLVACATPSGYSRYIENNQLLEGLFTKIEIKERNEEEVLEILKEIKTQFEYHHHVKYSDEILKDCVTLVKQHLPKTSLLSTTLNIIDEVGAKKHIEYGVNLEVLMLEEKLDAITKQKQSMNTTEINDKFDELTREELSLKKQINKIAKRKYLDKSFTPITKNDVLKLISEKTTIPVTEMTENEMSKLSNLEDKLNGVVIGQTEAVKAVTRSVKRQRVGISNPNKPAVMMFVGKSGTGKTYLAKKLSEFVFGNDKSFVRLDMSEYADKTSVTKLYGSSPGYVGYENGGILTESVKKNGHCVILLDEIEKANEEVHNAFLQLFDEGRMTDNTGKTVDFSNTIIIMTSNVGTQEALLRGGGVGFLKDEKNYVSIVRKAIKDKFRPEFINRIDTIAMFNDLSDDNLRAIILLEMQNLNERVKNVGYGLSERFINDACDFIFKELQNTETEGMGARPILRLIQENVEDVIIDIIIENNIQKGTVFDSFETKRGDN